VDYVVDFNRDLLDVLVLAHVERGLRRVVRADEITALRHNRGVQPVSLPERDLDSRELFRPDDFDKPRFFMAELFSLFYAHLLKNRVAALVLVILRHVHNHAEEVVVSLAPRLIATHLAADEVHLVFGGESAI
jgi:hypothetical protein